MRTTPWRILPVLVMGACLFVTRARADTIYTYTGNAFSDYLMPELCPTPTCSLSLSFTVSAPIVSLSWVFFTPDTFSISDGFGFPLTNATPGGVSSSFSIMTTDTGSVDGWWFWIGYQPADVRYYSYMFDGDSCDWQAGTNTLFNATALCPPEVPLYGNWAYELNDPGTWSVSTSPVPEPSTLALLGSGLLGVVGLIRRKRLA